MRARADALRRLVGPPGTRRFAAARGAGQAAAAARAGARRARIAAVESPPAGTGQVLGRRDLVPVLATIDPTASPHSTHLATVRWLAGLLDAEGIEHWFMSRDETFVDVGVADEALPRLVELVALRCVAGDPGLWLVGDGAARVPVPGRVAVGNDLRGSPIAVVLVHADPSGTHLVDSAGAVGVQRWALAPDGSRSCAAANRWASVLPASSLSRPVRMDVHGVDVRTLADLAVPHIEDVDFPIDVVCTWVDGGDPAWRARMQAHRPEAAVPTAATSDTRFDSLDELRHCLRSVHQNAPWVRRIWLVTDAQRPAWLAEDERVTVIDHREIWTDPTVLPVFNSHAIESQLQHIPGLAEHYVYLNDDVLLTRPLRPTAFFTPGGVMGVNISPVHIGLGDPQPDDLPVPAAGKNDRALLLEATGAVQTRRLKHTGHAQRRSIANELEQRYPEAFARTAAARFRSPTDVSPVSLHSWYALRTGHAVPVDTRLLYVDLAWPDARARLAQLSRGQFDAACVNQTEGSPAQAIDHVADALARAFPFRAPWETTD